MTKTSSASSESTAPLAISADEALARLTPYMSEDRGRSARIFWGAWGLVLGLVLGVVFIDLLVIRLALAVLLGGMFTRLFVIFHDTEHGAIFRQDAFKRSVMRIFSYLVAAPPTVWKDGHTKHHRETGVYDEQISGEFPVWTVERYRNANAFDRFIYRLMRNPLTIAFGYASAFVIGSCVLPFIENPSRHWRGPVALFAHFGLIAILWATLGWQVAITLLVIPALIAGGLGAYLIYVQHNMPGLDYAAKETRSPIFSAFRTATFFKMNGFMHWVTANIGFHNVHHLAPRIPFYRLPAAMAALPELRDCVTETSWSLRDMRAAFRANLYDPAIGMVRYAAARG
ncbi:MAG: fatty acid desaturase [Pseudomonadota bacterium]